MPKRVLLTLVDLDFPCRVISEEFKFSDKFYSESLVFDSLKYPLNEMVKKLFVKEEVDE